MTNDDESLLDELAGAHDGDHHDEHDQHEDGHAAPARGRRRGDRHRSPLRAILPVLLVVVVLLGAGIGGVYGYRWVTGNVSVQKEETDYPGPGTGEATIVVHDGDSGGDIAKSLVEADVIKSTGPFTTQFANSPDASSISPGTYRLKKQMSSSDALKLLLDPSSRAGTRVTIPEGMRMSAMFEKLSSSTGIPVADFEAAIKDYTALGVPANPANSPEGYFWPGTYDVPEDATAADVLTMMAGRMQDELAKRGVKPEDEHRVLTLASIAEKEARSSDDYGKVVRTIDNRLAGVGEAGGNPMRLQLDSTVAYASGKNTISTTPEERASDSPYNTYVHDGLPIGPISNPGGATIDAALNPPDGPWLYWVTVNTDTGETKFAATKTEHDANVREWQEWAKTKG
ncbi:endolytic transglycosylase MltG [Brachybacterium huguangmaarense]|uniref:Endolytic murein transglycosylase n=1 Tax=Brachybacterium huguangmaarense TaxID=1652028 RepID=A0ABY6FZE3_9MICO|nr:endolytic transglycosylase MltG [Brachybacterium huguangmaarense]UYG16285.1 endolytic transglycosylase MltG [Brachybacterium huguangmaarense]